jgi:hypothetical protein
MAETGQIGEGKLGWGAAISNHPGITLFMLVCIVVGILTGLFLLPDAWSALRRALAGLLGGAGCGFLVVATRMMGAFDFSPDD